MSENDNQVVYQEQKFGRTWADFLTSTGGLILIVLIIGLSLFFGVDYLSLIPVWVWIAIPMSLIFYPFLVERAKEDANLFLVADGPQRLTEYRIGRKVPIDIDGIGVPLFSRSGTSRQLLTDFDPISLRGEGSALAEFNLFEMARDLNTLDRLSKAFAEHLRSERITQELITVEVEKRVKELSERWIEIAMGTLEPDELERALALAKEQMEIHTSVSEILGDEWDDES